MNCYNTEVLYFLNHFFHLKQKCCDNLSKNALKEYQNPVKNLHGYGISSNNNNAQHYTVKHAWCQESKHL